MFRTFLKSNISQIPVQRMTRAFGQVVELTTSEQWEEVTSKPGQSVIVDFYADWCGPCQQLIPELVARAEKPENDVILLKVNVDNFGELAQAFQVSSIPHVFLLKNQEVVSDFKGTSSNDQLDTFFESAQP